MKMRFRRLSQRRRRRNRSSSDDGDDDDVTSNSTSRRSSTSSSWSAATDTSESVDAVVGSGQTSATSSARKPTVTFSSLDDVYDVLPLHEYTEDERCLTWYQAEDFALTHRKAQKLIRKMSEGTADGYCTRGLERLVGDRLEQTRTARQKAYDAVWRAQRTWHKQQQHKQQQHKHKQQQRHRQPESVGLGLDVVIADAYAKESRSCQSRAEAVAAEDRKAIGRYLRSNKKRRSKKRGVPSGSSKAATLLSEWKEGSLDRQDRSMEDSALLDDDTAQTAPSSFSSMSSVDSDYDWGSSSVLEDSARSLGSLLSP